MNSNINVLEKHLHIVNNFITDEDQKNKCIDAIKNYESNQSNTENPTAIIRFSRFITLENSINADSILEELSLFPNDNSDAADTIVLLQLSSTIDSFLTELTPANKCIYLYRYFYGYSIDDIAGLCNTSASNVQKMLSQCNNKLKNLLITNNLTVDSHSLLLSLTDIDDSHLLSTINSATANNLTTKPTGTKLNKKKSRLNIAIGIAIVSLIGLNIFQHASYSSKLNAHKSKANSEAENAINLDQFFVDEEGKKVVNINKLLEYTAYSGDEYLSPELSLNGFITSYTAYEISEDIPLEKFIGEEIPELETKVGKYYKLLGADNYQYIIYKTDKRCALFEASYRYLTDAAINNASSSHISYENSLMNLYGIYDATDITEIRLMAGDSNTGYADSYTAKLIDYEDDIKAIYYALTNSNFTGKTIDTLVESGFTDYDYLMDKSLHMFIYTKYSPCIQSLCYYPDGNFFFDYTNYIVYEIDNSANTEYLKELLTFNVHNTEFIEPELWGYMVRVSDVDPMFLSLNIQCEQRSYNIGKYLGSDFILEIKENGKWVEYPILTDYADTPKFLFDTKLDASSNATNLSIYFLEKYGYLLSGEYRLTFNIYDINSPDINNPACQDYVVEFQIN